MSPDKEGWIKWEGGECPVLTEARIDVKLRGGTVGWGPFASEYRWDHINNPGDIRAYRIAGEKEERKDLSTHDNVNNPKHYTSHPSGVECIQITEHMGFNLGNAIKYLWRADEKGNALEDLKKAAWYVQREIERREKSATQPPGAQP